MHSRWGRGVPCGMGEGEPVAPGSLGSGRAKRLVYRPVNSVWVAIARMMHWAGLFWIKGWGERTLFILPCLNWDAQYIQIARKLWHQLAKYLYSKDMMCFFVCLFFTILLQSFYIFKCRGNNCIYTVNKWLLCSWKRTTVPDQRMACFQSVYHMQMRLHDKNIFLKCSTIILVFIFK